MCGDQCVVLSWRLLALTRKGLECGSRRPLSQHGRNLTRQGALVCPYSSGSSLVDFPLSFRVVINFCRAAATSAFSTSFSIYMYVTARDHTERKRSARMLEASNRWYSPRCEGYDLRCAHPIVHTFMRIVPAWRGQLNSHRSAVTFAPMTLVGIVRFSVVKRFRNLARKIDIRLVPCAAATNAGSFLIYRDLFHRRSILFAHLTSFEVNARGIDQTKQKLEQNTI